MFEPGGADPTMTPRRNAPRTAQILSAVQRQRCQWRGRDDAQSCTLRHCVTKLRRRPRPRPRPRLRLRLRLSTGPDATHPMMNGQWSSMMRIGSPSTGMADADADASQTGGMQPCLGMTGQTSRSCHGWMREARRNCANAWTGIAAFVGMMQFCYRRHEEHRTPACRWSRSALGAAAAPTALLTAAPAQCLELNCS